MEGRIIKARLAIMGKSQRWLIDEIARRGVTVSETEFSHIMAGRRTGPKAEMVLAIAKEIVKDAV